MKKTYKLLITEEVDDTDSLSNVEEELEAEEAWLDTGTIQVLLPTEIVSYVEKTGILGIT